MKIKFNGILTFLLTLTVQFIFAQTTISGTVSDETGPLPGVNVVVQGTTTGTETDFDGKYSILVKEGETLVFSYVGYGDVHKVVGKESVMDIIMTGSTVLDEVVITGYSNKSRDVLTSGVSTVSEKELEEVSSVTNVTNALQGKAAGVVVTAANGKPGQNAFVRIRGVGSVNAGQEPLYIIDGVPVSENDMNVLNSADVETISVLKDAASASAYGARGSNGVVVITTKSGKSGAAKITLSSQVGFSHKIKDNYDMMNAEQKLQYEKEVGLGTVGSSIVLKQDWDKLVSYDHDWQEDLLKVGFVNSTGLSINGGGEKATYFVSLKNEGDTGIIESLDGYKRNVARFNINSNINDYIALKVNTGVAHTYSEEPRDRNNVQNPFRSMYDYNPYETIYKLDDNGQVLYDDKGNVKYNLTHQGFSISEALVNNPESEERLRFIGGIGVDVKLFDGSLVYSPNVSMTYNTLRREVYTQPGSVLDGYVGDQNAPGSKRDFGKFDFTYNILNKITYNNTFGEVHSIALTLLNEMNANNYRSYDIRSKGFPSADLNIQSVASAPDGNQSTYRSERALLAYGALFDYDYDETYVASLSIRRDGSSVFGKDHRYGTFWSVSGAWNIHKEDFMNSVSNYINRLKLRASYGTLGNDRLPNRYGHLGTYSFTNYNGMSAAYPHNVSNPDLKWEEKAVLDLGLEFSMFNSRLNGLVNYFQSKTTDLLFKENLSQESGESGYPASRYTNFGDISSRGLELELNGDAIRTNNFTWNLGGTIAFVKNMVDKLPGGADYLPSRYNLILREGEELYTSYLVRYAGVNPANGRALYYDKDGNVTQDYNPNDAVVLEGKTVTPDFDGSFNTLFKYKGVSLSGNFYFKYGNYIYNNQEMHMLSGGENIKSNQRLDAFNFWRKPGDTGVLPDPRNPLNTSQVSDRFLQDGSYIRLRNVRLGYDVSKDLLKGTFINSVVIYFQGQNLWTYVPYFKGDPEVGIGSSESYSPTEVGFIPGAYNLYSYPTTKSYLLGVDLIF